MYEEALRTLQRKFGQPQAVVSAYWEKLSKKPGGEITLFGKHQCPRCCFQISWIQSRFEQHQSFESSCSKSSAQPQRSVIIFHCQTVSRATVTSRIQHMAPAKGRSA